MKLAETKRSFVFGEAYNTIGTIGAGAAWEDTFLTNVFGFLTVGTSDEQFIVNQIIDPLAVLRLSVQINWGTVLAQAGGIIYPFVAVDAYLIASPQQFPTSVAPRLTSSSEDTFLWLKYPSMFGRNTFLHTLNGQGVIVIKKKRVVIRPPTGAGISTHTLKLVKRFKGTKTFDTVFSTAGVQTKTAYLKGWNFYYLVQTTPNVVTTTASSTGNGIQVVGDRYIYFKDL